VSLIQTQTTSFKRELYCGFHAFDSEYRAADTFKIALYTSSASLDSTTTAYTATNEISGSGYVAGGAVLTPTTPAFTGTTAYLNFATVSWTGALTASAALIYNSTQGNRSVCVLAFGNNKTSTTQFVIQFPVTDAFNALIRTT
jgi:hypothetical protein